MLKENPDITYREIASYLNTKYNTSYWDSERIRDRRRKISKRKNKINYSVIPEEKFIVTDKNKKKILILADLHIPYHREDIFDVVRENINFVDAIVLAGDSFDNESLSKFSAIGKRKFKEDLTYFYDTINKIALINNNNIPIYIIRGNHEERLAKYISTTQQDELSEFLNPQVVQMLVDGFTIYSGYDKIVYPPIPNIVYINNWYMNINDSILICHQKDFNRPKLKTVCNGIDYFIENKENFDAIFLAHMHTAGYTRHMTKHGYNIPCMCKPQEYTNKGNFCYKPQAYGYMILALDDNGKFDINNSRTVILNEKYPNVNEKVEYKVSI
jgi:predicted phosphodiesterase